MGHMAAVLARQFHQCSFDERADTGDLPQDRLAPRHEPILTGFVAFMIRLYYIRANNSNKKSACDNIFCRRRSFRSAPAAFPPSIQPLRNGSQVRQIHFLKAWQ